MDRLRRFSCLYTKCRKPYYAYLSTLILFHQNVIPAEIASSCSTHLRERGGIVPPHPLPHRGLNLIGRRKHRERIARRFVPYAAIRTALAEVEDERVRASDAAPRASRVSLACPPMTRFDKCGGAAPPPPPPHAAPSPPQSTS